MKKIDKINENVKEEYQIREGVPDARYSGKYTLYQRYSVYADGTRMAIPGLYGSVEETFKTLEEAQAYIIENNLQK